MVLLSIRMDADILKWYRRKGLELRQSSTSIMQDVITRRCLSGDMPPTVGTCAIPAHYVGGSFVRFPAREMVGLYLEDEVVEWYKSATRDYHEWHKKAARGYQERIKKALRMHMQRRRGVPTGVFSIKVERASGGDGFTWAARLPKGHAQEGRPDWANLFELMEPGDSTLMDARWRDRFCVAINSPTKKAKFLPWALRSTKVGDDMFRVCKVPADERPRREFRTNRALAARARAHGIVIPKDDSFVFIPDEGAPRSWTLCEGCKGAIHKGTVVRSLQGRLFHLRCAREDSGLGGENHWKNRRRHDQKLDNTVLHGRLQR